MITFLFFCNKINLQIQHFKCFFLFFLILFSLFSYCQSEKNYTTYSSFLSADINTEVSATEIQVNLDFGLEGINDATFVDISNKINNSLSLKTNLTYLFMNS